MNFIKRTIVDRDFIDSSEEKLLIKTIGEIANVVFDVVSDSERIAHSLITDKNAHKCYVILYKDRILKQTVGFSIARFMRVNEHGHRYCFLRGSSGILPKYRKKNITQYDLLTFSLKYRIRYNFIPLYFVGYFPSPEGYKSFADIYPYLYPSIGYNSPNCEERKILLNASRILGYRNINAGGEFFFYNFSKIRTRFDIKKTNKNVEYFCKINPKYADGVALGSVLKLSIRNLLVGMFLYLCKKIKKWFINKYEGEY